MGERDYVFVPIAVLAPKVRNETKDFRRDLANWCNPVPPGPNEVEDFESVLFNDIELKYNMNQSQCSCPFVHSFHLSLV